MNMNPQEIRQTVMAYQKSRIILTAFELDVFTLIGDKGLKAERIAQALSLDTKAAVRLLNALVAIQLLEKRDDVYSNKAESLMFLSKDSPSYLAGLGHSTHLWNTWSHLSEVVRTGHPAHGTEINDRGDEWLSAFIHAMHDRGKQQAPAQVAHLDLDGISSVLDVGGGSGCYDMAFLDRKPSLQAAVFDLPNVIPISKRIVDKEGYSGRIAHYTGDYTRDALPGGFDMVFLSAIIHSNSFETNQALVKSCYHALNPGGRIVIQDWIMNDDKTLPVQGAIFSINMLVGTGEGDCYSEKEVRAWFAEAGFSFVSRNELDGGLGQMIGEKEETAIP